jgi:hypothetical protein
LTQGCRPLRSQVQEYAGDLLRRQLDRCDGGVEIAFQGDIDVRILGARAVIGEVERLVDQSIDEVRADPNVLVERITGFTREFSCLIEQLACVAKTKIVIRPSWPPPRG